MPKKWIIAALTATGLTVGLAAPAAAHVTAQPDEAEQGGYGAIAFRVPNERPDAGTVSLEVKFPAEHPLESVRTKPIPGWTAAVGRDGDRVSTVTWTAEEGVRIEPDQYQEFEVSAGPLPTDTDLMVLPATQTYDSGEVVAWDEPPADDGASEPEHPAPVLRLVPSTGSGHHQGGDSAQTSSDAPAQGGGSEAAPEAHGETATTAASTVDSASRLLGGTGLALGALALGVATGALLRIRRRGSA